MPNTQTRNVSLATELTASINAQVASGDHSNANEVARAGLRLLIEGDHAPTTDGRPAAHEAARADDRPGR